MSLSIKAIGKRFGLLAALLAALVIACTGVVLAQSKSTSSTGGTAAAPGTHIEVTTQEDEDNTDGDCSLREAILAADTNAAVDGCAAGSSSERDAIHFALGEKATITLGTFLPDITAGAGLTINGQKAKITVSGDDKVRVFFVQGDTKLNLNHLTVADGKSEGHVGGGLVIGGGGAEVKVRNSTFSGNSSGFGGGGITNRGNVTLEVTNSTFSGNSAVDNGGGIENFGATLEVTNSTFSGNSATQSGGGIDNRGGTLEVTNSTFSGNSAGQSGGGIRIVGGTTTFKNTIVANSTQGGNCFTTLNGTIADEGYNIEDGTSCSFSAANNSMPSTEPKLFSLADNGGPTQTFKLRRESPAIDAIPNATNGCGTQITTDQRGVSRPQGSGCDIGAFEREQP
jgi:CSLREA domain-containing protein